MKALRLLIILVVCAGVFFFRIGKPKPKTSAPLPNEIPVTVQKNIEPEAKYKPFPKGSLFDSPVYREFAVFYLPKPKKDPKETLQQLCSTQFSMFHFVPKFSKDTLELTQWPSAAPLAVTIKDYHPANEDNLKYSGHGLSAEEVAGLQKSEEVFIVAFTDKEGPAYASLKESQRLMLALAKETGGLLWDESTRETFSLDAWEKRRIKTWTEDIPRVPDHFTAHVYSTGELTRFITLGMSKFGLPDVCIERVARNSYKSMGGLLNVVCQTLAEKGALEKEGEIAIDIPSLKNQEMRSAMIASYLDKATGKAILKLAEVEPQEGDNANRLIEVRFTTPKNASIHERQLAIISQVFGSSDSISHVKHDDAMLRLSEKARLELSKLKPAFVKGLPPGESLMVKGPFRTPRNGNEWMWVEAVKWNEATIDGILMNDPFEIPTLKAGARVSVQIDSVFDYIYQKADGTTVGNETSEYIKNHEVQGK